MEVRPYSQGRVSRFVHDVAGVAGIALPSNEGQDATVWLLRKIPFADPEYGQSE